jgi:hypothetical protein
LCLIKNQKKNGENYIMKSFMICTHCQVYIIRIIMARRLRLAGHVARMGEKRKVVGGKARGKDPTRKTKT